MNSNANYRAKLLVAGLVLCTAVTAHATKQIKATPKSKHIIHTGAHSTAPMTCVFATGTFDPANSTVKVITSENRFAWIHIAPSVVVMRGSKRVGAETIQEDDKIVCQGLWVDDGGSLTLRATSVKITGQISYGSLHDKIAAACQNITEDSGSRERVASVDDFAPNAPTAADEGAASEASVKSQAVLTYIDEMSTQVNAVDHAMTIATEILDERTYLHYGDLKARWDKNSRDCSASMSKLCNIYPVPREMFRASSHIRQSCVKYNDFLALGDEYFATICCIQFDGRTSDHYKKIVCAPLFEGDELQEQAIHEIKQAVTDKPR